MGETKKVGRPRKTNKKTAKVFVNLTESEKQKLDKIALKENLSLSQICYKALKNSKII